MADDEIYENIKQCIADGDEDWARELAQQGLGQGVSPLDLIEKGFTPALRAVGDRWDAGAIFLPEMILSADAMKAAVRVLQPALQNAGAGAHEPKSCVVGAVKGDIHDIGKSIVGALVDAAGLNVIDLGTNVETARFGHRDNSTFSARDLPESRDANGLAPRIGCRVGGCGVSSPPTTFLRCPRRMTIR